MQRLPGFKFKERQVRSQELGASSGSPMLVQVPKHLGHPIMPPQEHHQGAEIGSGAGRTQASGHMDAGTTHGSLACYAMVPTPVGYV